MVASGTYAGEFSVESTLAREDRDGVTLGAALEAGGFGYRRLLSGAGHDSVYVSRVAPTAMIFVPCRDGISHNEAEYASPEHCAQGCQVLCDALVARAGVAA